MVALEKAATVSRGPVVHGERLGQSAQGKIMIKV